MVKMHHGLRGDGRPWSWSLLRKVHTGIAETRFPHVKNVKNEQGHYGRYKKHVAYMYVALTCAQEVGDVF